MVEDPPLTDLIRRAQDGDAHALKSVFDVTYHELRQLARARLSRGGRGTLLDTSALVHESYLRFANAGQLRIEDRQHFLRYSSHVMRSVVVDLMAARRFDEALPELDTRCVPRGEDLRRRQLGRAHDALPARVRARQPRTRGRGALRDVDRARSERRSSTTSFG